MELSQNAKHFETAPQKNRYTPLVARETYLQREGRSLLERLYGNSLRSLVASLYDGKAIGWEDLRELRRFIEERTEGGEER